MKQLYVPVLSMVVPFFSATAQPTLTSGSASPVPGDESIYQSALFMDQGPAGAGQTWDLSSLTNLASATRQWVAPVATGVGGPFPNATVAVGLTANHFLFYKATATGFEEDGFSLLTTVSTCGDRLTLMQYPLAFGGVFSDDMQCDITDGVTSWEETATITAGADSYGTLVLPWGTVNDVLRVRTQTHREETQYGTVSDYDTYSWYKPGVHFAIATIETRVATFSGFTIRDSSTAVLDASAIGMEEALRYSIGVDLQPNPATDRVEVVYGVAGGRALSIDLIDLTGTTVRTFPRTTNAAGVQRETIDLHGLSGGAYLVRVTDHTGAFGMKRLVKQ